MFHNNENVLHVVITFSYTKVATNKSCCVINVQTCRYRYEIEYILSSVSNTFTSVSVALYFLNHLFNHTGGIIKWY